jgi:hypothetical protein
VHDGPQVAERIDDPGHEQDDDDGHQRDARLFVLGSAGEQHEITVSMGKPEVIPYSAESATQRRGSQSPYLQPTGTVAATIEDVQVS